VILAITLALTIQNKPYTLELRTSRDQTCLLTGEGKSHAFAPKRLNPWQIRAGYVDENGKMDILVGVFKKTNLIPHPHPTLFIYEFTGEQVRPIWKASTLGRPLLDFAPFESEKGRRVVTIERTLDGKQALALWKWRGFGLYKLEDLTVAKHISLQLPWIEKTIVAKVDGNTLKWKR
jgi:hypothetical protein